MTDSDPDPQVEGTGPSGVSIAAPPDVVFEQLLDVGSYPQWLIGAQRIRAVDVNWPMVGSSFQHVIGLGPFRVPGSTTIAAAEPPRELQLSAGMGVFGRAVVSFRIEPEPGSDGRATIVRMHEVAAAGPARWAWTLVRPLLVALLFGRNALSLHHLRDLVEAQNGGDAGAAGASTGEGPGG